MPQDLSAVWRVIDLRLGVRAGNVDGVPVIRIRHELLDLDDEQIGALLRDGTLIGFRRDWIFARAAL